MVAILKAGCGIVATAESGPTPISRCLSDLANWFRRSIDLVLSPGKVAPSPDRLVPSTANRSGPVRTGLIQLQTGAAASDRREADSQSGSGPYKTDPSGSRLVPLA
jgi:hypothetical protein